MISKLGQNAIEALKAALATRLTTGATTLKLIVYLFINDITPNATSIIGDFNRPSDSGLMPEKTLDDVSTAEMLGIASRIEGFEYLCVSSHSHRPPAANRVRLVMPMTRPALRRTRDRRHVGPIAALDEARLRWHSNGRLRLRRLQQRQQRHRHLGPFSTAGYALESGRRRRNRRDRNPHADERHHAVIGAPHGEPAVSGLAAPLNVAKCRQPSRTVA